MPDIDDDTTAPGNTGLSDELTPEEKAMFEGEGEVEETPDVPEEPKEPNEEEVPASTPSVPEDEEDNDGEEVVDLEGTNKGRFVRHGAFHRQRMKAQEEKTGRLAAETERNTLREERARVDERLSLLMQAAQQQPQQQPQPGEPKGPPNPEEDPFAYMRYLEEQITRLGETTNNASERIQAQDTYSGVKSAFVADAQQYAAKTADFPEAYNHLIRARDRELMMLGKTDPRERAAIVAQEELMIVSECLKNRKSPSELMYALAAERGYRKAEPAAPAAQAPVADAAPAQRQTAVQQVAGIKKGQEASKSLSSASGGTHDVVTAESLASMPEAEFEKLYAKMSRDQRRDYFGGA